MDEIVNILVIEDNSADTDLIREYLSEVSEFAANLFSVSTLKEAQKFMSNNVVNAVLVDLSLPDSQGMDTVKAVVSCMKSATAIVLTSLDDKVTALNAIESGAQDYILKNTLGSEALARVIRYAMQRNKWQQKINEVQEQLNQSQKMESIGRLAGGIAHEFNNQLAVVTLLCPMIESNLPQDHISLKYVHQILSSSQKSAELVKRLLAFSRKHPAELKVVDLNEILLESEILLSKLIGENISTEMKVSKKKALVRIDAPLMEQVLLNLAINARDAMPNGGSLIFESFIKTQQEGDTNKSNVILKITDTGQGIKSENLAKIFEPFFTTKEVAMGTGLGLAMVYGTVQLCNGKIAVESILNRGTTFTISLPFVDDEVPYEVKPTHGGLDKKIGNETILIVEDEDLLREIFHNLLEENGYNIFTAKNGVEALQVLANPNYAIDLIITDLNMPKMGGMELREKTILNYPNMKFMLMSGYLDKLSELDMHSLKNTGYIPKPAKANVILLKIREILEK